MTTTRARIYDAWALFLVVFIVAVDQWTKTLVVENLSPPEIGPTVPIIGDYLVLRYIRNSGAAFGLLANNVVLILLIGAAVGVVAYLYLRMLNTGSLAYKLIFGMIMGGAVGNLIDRARHSGYVVDFIFFRIPQIGFRFYIFNIADACISVGVFLLLVLILLGGLGLTHSKTADPKPGPQSNARQQMPPPTNNSGSLRPSEKDA